MTTQPHPYDSLTPDVVLDAIEGAGFNANGRLLALNSYENRVYQIGIDDSDFVIAKFYRPARWSDTQILEEHRFSQALSEAEVPVVAPLPDEHGETVLHHQGFRFALYPRRGGHGPELGDLEVLLRLGRFLGRLHLVGASEAFDQRPTLDVTSFGRNSLDYLIQHQWLPSEYRSEFTALCEEMLEGISHRFDAVDATAIRLHGDFHPGNILWTDRGAHLVDLDDSRMGPAVQDLWMMLSGERNEMIVQLDALLEGYQEFREFDFRELALIEPLRTLRLLHYTAWLARRWDDPAFPQAFPWFDSPKYWEEQLLVLREQKQRLAEPPLTLWG